MAKSYSTRLEAKSSARRRTRARIAISAARGPRSSELSGRNSLKRRRAVAAGVTHPKWIVELQQIVRVLGGVYSSCVTAQLALRSQDAEMDHDIMRMLMMDVSGPVGRQVERLDAVVMGLTDRGEGGVGAEGPATVQTE